MNFEIIKTVAPPILGVVLGFFLNNSYQNYKTKKQNRNLLDMAILEMKENYKILNIATPDDSIIGKGIRSLADALYYIGLPKEGKKISTVKFNNFAGKLEALNTKSKKQLEVLVSVKYFEIANKIKEACEQADSNGASCLSVNLSKDEYFDKCTQLILIAIDAQYLLKEIEKYIQSIKKEREFIIKEKANRGKLSITISRIPNLINEMQK